MLLLPTTLGQTIGSSTVNPVSSPTAPTVEWQQTFSTGDSSEIGSMIHTSDGGYAIVGTAMFIVMGRIGPWMFKFDSAGNQQWNQPYYSQDANSNLSGAKVIVQTADGGYAFAGLNAYLVKTDSEGRIQWRQNYAGGLDPESLVITQDGGYALAGSTNQGFWLAKTNSAGTLQWNQTYVIGDHSQCMAMVQTDDGGYALAGFSSSSSGSYAALVKVNSIGNMLWTQTYNGPSGSAQAFSLTKTNDGGFALGGMGVVSNSTVAMLIKTDVNGNLLWNQTYIELKGEPALSVIQTSDGGYALGCGWFGPSSGMLLKTDTEGNPEWNITLNDTVRSVVQLSNGAYVFAGGNFANYNFLMGTNGSSIAPPSPTPIASQTPSPTATPLQTPQSTPSPTPTSSSATQPKNNESNNLGYYLILAIVIVIATVGTIFGLKRRRKTSPFS